MFESLLNIFKRNKKTYTKEDFVGLTILPFKGKDFVFLGVPKECPHCNKLAQMDIVNMIRGPNKNIDLTLVVFQCMACRELVVGRYIGILNGFNLYIERNKTPFYPNKEYTAIDFPEEINKVSPYFQSIYNQAAKAEHYGCIDIAGAGFRKATEFLVRDFAIYKNENKKEKILNTSAPKNVIRNFLNEYPRISRAAMASLELGNDEVHYSKIYTEYALKDLKSFIEIAVGEILHELKLEQFEKDSAETKNKDLMPINQKEKISQKFDVPKNKEG